MRKIIIFYFCAVTLISLINYPFYFNYRFLYYAEDTFVEDVQNNLDYYNSGEVFSFYRKHYKDDIIDLLNLIDDIELNLVPEFNAKKILIFNNINENAFSAKLPLANNSEFADPRLTFLQIFSFDGQDYLLCSYRVETYYDAYALYEYDGSEAVKTMFTRDCFIDVGIFDKSEFLFKNSFLVTVRQFLPMFIVMIILFLPVLVERKERSGDRGKLAKIMAKSGFCIIPVWLIIIFIKLYLGK